MLKWSIELAQFDIEYKSRSAIKGKVLADLIAEFTGPVGEELSSSSILTWELYVDGSSCEHGPGVGLLLVNLEGHKIPYALRFDFKETNNKAEYEVLLAGLRLARERRAEHLLVFSDSQFVVCQILGEYQAKGPKMIACLQKVWDLMFAFERCEVTQVPEFSCVALARLASVQVFDSLGAIPVEFLAEPSGERQDKVLTIVTRMDYG